ncbi:MAG: universal stress protein [Planctomycetaceae bacterium]
MSPQPIHILLPTDLRSDVWPLLQVAFQFDAALRARLTLLHVAPPAGFQEPKRDLSALAHLRDTLRLPSASAAACPTILNPRKRDLAVVARHLRRRLHPEWQGFVDIQAVTRQGDVSKEIVRFAREESVDLILLAAKPRSSWWNWRRNVCDEVLRQAPCRVVLVQNPSVSTAAPPVPEKPRDAEKISKLV